MHCPFCFNNQTTVKDSREVVGRACVRRRRFCCSCNGKFTTLEKIELISLKVIKKSGVREDFQEEKIERTLNLVLKKNKLAIDKIKFLTERIIINIENNSKYEIEAAKITEIIMQELIKIDYLSYLRFAFLYGNFQNYEEFKKFANNFSE